MDFESFLLVSWTFYGNLLTTVFFGYLNTYILEALYT